MNDKQKLGFSGEQFAKEKLSKLGLIFVDQNFHTRVGEIDLIFRDEKNIIFVEVKTRSSFNLGSPEEAVSKSKLTKLEKTADIFLAKNVQYDNLLPRVDVVAIVMENGGIVYFKHYQNIFLE